MFRFLLSILTLISLILPIISYKYFAKLMKIAKIKTADAIVAGVATMFAGYIFFMLPWIFVGEEIEPIRIFSYFVVLAGLIILLYAVVKIYSEWKEVVK